MGYLQLQGRFGVFGTGYSYSRRASKNQSALVFGMIIFVHAVIILLVINEKFKQRELVPERILHMINILPKSVESVAEPDKPLPNVPKSFQLSVPQLQFAEPVLSPLDIPLNDSPYTLPSEKSGQYGNVFDPKMRQKLLDAQALNRPRTSEKSKTWTEIDGRTFVDMGNGQCMVSMPKVDARERETNWGMTTCGKTESEKVMDRINAEMEARKLPIKKRE